MNATQIPCAAVLLTLLMALAWLATPALARSGVPAGAASTAASPAVAATVGQPTALTLEQAVARVRAKTHGKVLRASSRIYGNMVQYRIKVLTPDGHVRVIPVRARSTRSAQPEPKEVH